MSSSSSSNLWEIADPALSYTNYQPRERRFRLNNSLMIVTFDPEKAGISVQAIDSSKGLRVTGRTKICKLRNARAEDDQVVDTEIEEEVIGDVNDEQGFARVRITNPNVAKDEISRLKDNGFITNSIFSMREILKEKDQKGNIKFVLGPTGYFVPGLFTILLKDISEAFAKKFFSDNSISYDNVKKLNEKRKRKIPGSWVAELPSDIKGSEEEKLFQTYRKFNGNPGFEAVKKDVILAFGYAVGFNDELSSPDPTDSYWTSGTAHWGIRTGGAGAYGANVKSAWDKDWSVSAVRRIGHQDVIVGIVDSGCDPDNADLINRVFEPDPNPIADNNSGSHGTNVAAVVAAQVSYQGGANPNYGFVGVAPGCRITPVQIDLSVGDYLDRAAAIDYVRTRANANAGMRYIINLSWKTTTDDDNIRNAISNAVTANILVVCASMDAATSSTNGVDIGDWTAPGTGAIWPACYDNVVAVSAQKSDGNKRTDSNFRNGVTVYAPGDNCYSYNNSNTTITPAPVAKAKTSIAAAFVSGVAALAWSYDKQKNGAFDMPAYGANSLYYILTTRDTDPNPGALRALGGAAGTGKGRIDARQAVDRVNALTP